MAKSPIKMRWTKVLLGQLDLRNIHSFYSCGALIFERKGKRGAAKNPIKKEE
jgi:hypothetical protein